jgi:hypothetical protein
MFSSFLRTICLFASPGHTATNTAWNTAARLSIVTPPYDTDGNNASFSNAELANIVAIWRAVAEDFAAFDVDITTEEPTDPLRIGSRAVIGGSSYDWYGAGAGGVAYVVSNKALGFCRV